MELLTADQRVPGSNPVVPSGMSDVKAMRDVAYEFGGIGRAQN